MCEILQGDFIRGYKAQHHRGSFESFGHSLVKVLATERLPKMLPMTSFFVCALCSTCIFLGLGNPDFLILFLEKYFRNIRGFFLIWWAYFWKNQGIEKKLISVRYSFCSNFFTVITIYLPIIENSRIYVCWRLL